MPLRLSIIIPFYNVEKFIAECLDSVFQQDIPLNEYEVICVNDGSPDRSRDIVLSFMGRYPNLRLIEHDCNRKLGAARNTGRSIAKGEYIWNVDSDDKIVPNCLDNILRQCEEKELDLLEFGASTLNENLILDHSPECKDVTTGLDYMSRLNSYEVSRLCPVWRKVIKRKFLDTNRIYSPEINMGEDIPFSFSMLTFAQRLSVTSESYYLYRLNNDSLTGINWKVTSDKLYEKCFVAPRYIMDIVNIVPTAYPQVKQSFTDSAKYLLSQYHSFYRQMTSNEQRRFKLICRRQLMKDKNVLSLMSKKNALKHIMLLLGFV